MTSMGYGESYRLLFVAGFHRYLGYRLAAAAGVAANVTFALLRGAILLAVVGKHGTTAGYDAASIISYAWLTQGLYAVVLMWGDGELAQRVRTGDVVVDLTRPWDLQSALLVGDLGRATFAVMVRLVPPVLIGAALFPFRWPHEPVSWPLFALSAMLAVVVSFAARFALDVCAFWTMEVRGATALYVIVAGILSGLTVPLGFFPHWAQLLLWCTPFPAMLQTPTDVFTENTGLIGPLAHQVAWAVALVLLGRRLLRAGERKLVVQGG